MMLLTRDIAARVASSMTCFNLSLRLKRTHRAATHVVLVRVDGLCVEPLFAFLLTLLDVFANPYVAVQPEDEVYATREGNEVRLQTTDEDGRNSNELPIP